jgi:class 3 adenylate cyclase
MDLDRQPPSGVVTFVLTDVVGSTKLWDAVPAEMAVALELHNPVVVAAVERHDGLVLKHRGEGDSTFSVFERPSDAVRAAYDVQLDLDAKGWPPGARIRVRIAVHTGEATYQDGDYLGTTVNRAARVRSVAEGGEVLVSASVAHVVADHLPLDTSLTTLGQVALRDLERQEELFALTGPGLALPGPVPRGTPDTDLLADKGVTKRERDVLDAVSERLTNATRGSDASTTTSTS